MDISDDFDCPAHLVVIELQFHISFTKREGERESEREGWRKSDDDKGTKGQRDKGREKEVRGIYRWRVSGAVWEGNRLGYSRPLILLLGCSTFSLLVTPGETVEK